MLRTTIPPTSAERLPGRRSSPISTSSSAESTPSTLSTKERRQQQLQLLQRQQLELYKQQKQQQFDRYGQGQGQCLRTSIVGIGHCHAVGSYNDACFPKRPFSPCASPRLRPVPLPPSHSYLNLMLKTLIRPPVKACSSLKKGALRAAIYVHVFGVGHLKCSILMTVLRRALVLCLYPFLRTHP